MTNFSTSIRVSHRRYRHAGLTLIEVIIAISIASAATVGVSALLERFNQDTKASLLAQQTRTFGEAAKAYISDNYAAIQGVATAATPAYINAQMLISTGHLTAGTSAQNGFGQSLCALVLEPTANKLQALVVSEGGVEIDDLTLGGIAAAIGGSGGGIYTSDPSTIRGAIGGWDIPASSFHGLANDAGLHCDGSAGSVSVVPGRAVMALWFENGDTASAFLARDPVPGRPELNEMNTPLVLKSIQTLEGACTQMGAIARDAVGAVLNCKSGVWKPAGAGSEFWKDPVATFALLPTCDASSIGHTRVVRSPTVGSGLRTYSCNGATWEALSFNDQGNLVVPSKILGSGSESSYGAMTMQGSKNSYSGLNFKSGEGNPSGTLMMNAGYSGFFRADDTNWRWYVDDAGNSWQPGTPNVADVYIRSIGRHASQIFGGTFSTNIYVGCYIGNPRAGYACGCPGGFGAHPSGQFSVYAGSDSNAYVCQQ